MPKGYVHVRLSYRKRGQWPDSFNQPAFGFESAVSLEEDVFRRLWPGECGEAVLGLVPIGAQAGLAEIRQHCVDDGMTNSVRVAGARLKLHCAVQGRWPGGFAQQKDSG